MIAIKIIRIQCRCCNKWSAVAVNLDSWIKYKTKQLTLDEAFNDEPLEVRELIAGTCINCQKEALNECYA